MNLSDDELSDDDEINVTDDLSLEILNELENNRKIEIIQGFRELIIKDPCFCGIWAISCYEILEYIKSSNIKILNINNDIILNEEQIYLFDNLYDDLFNKIENIKIYNDVVYKIFKKIYI
tara:strand:- start:310 stop:669 length:360 start_codon:yes stop_codon:yes gene_type:complete